MEEKYTEGQEVTKDIYTDVAIWCNAGGKYHIEEQQGKYIIAANAPLPEPTPEEVVEGLEAKYHMFRWEREAILAEGSQYSDFTKNIAQEIEGKAQVLRVADDAEEIAEAQQAEELAAQ